MAKGKKNHIDPDVPHGLRAAMRGERINTANVPFGSEAFLIALKQLEKGKTVTRFVMDLDEGKRLEMELVVTKLGDTKLPRSLKGFGS